MTTEINHYKWLRKSLGVLVMLLPVLPVLFGLLGQSNPPDWFTSISATYYTNSVGLISGIFAICGFFFISYPGYDLQDKIVNKISGFSLLIILLFPCADKALCIDYPIGLFQLPPEVSSIIHNTTALFLFGSLWYNIMFLFTKSNGEKTEKKKLRNLIYRISGFCIIPCAGICLLGCNLGWFPHWFILLAEAIALIPCGISWLVKAEAIHYLND